jgi:hypothetical protein
MFITRKDERQIFALSMTTPVTFTSLSSKQANSFAMSATMFAVLAEPYSNKVKYSCRERPSRST